jgi:hypothetical protein
LRKRVHKGANILDRLLTAEVMRRPWKRIDRHVQKNIAKVSRKVAYQRLWGEIIVTLQRSKRAEPPRAETRDKWNNLAVVASRLANDLRDGPLDLPAYRFYPSDVANLAFSQDWSTLDHWQQQKLAYALAKEWPTLPELLAETAAKATCLAHSAMTAPRLVERTTRDRQANYFIRNIADYFRKAFRAGAMEGTVAVLASVVLEKEIDVAFVKKALRSTRKIRTD